MNDIRIGDKIRKLIDKGVRISNPFSVDIGEEVDIDRIAGEGVVIYPGCRIYGKDTLIMQGTNLGYESPVTIDNCQIGENVQLKGGFFNNSLFLNGASFSSSAHVREGCIIEEEAKAAHCVGLKQTILFPFVTLGSLINFCDCLMAGGTSKRNHSEVGSSYVHFNYSPNQDKATASLFGDVPKGVMLNQKPIFLGGQGGVVGPAKLAYGSVIEAGMVFRCEDYHEEEYLSGEKLIRAKRIEKKTKDFHKGIYRNIRRRVLFNVEYCANLIALRHWYTNIRTHFFNHGVFGTALFSGAIDKLDNALNERIRQFRRLVDSLPQSAQNLKKIAKGVDYSEIITQKQEIFDKWEAVEEVFYKYRDMEMVSIDKEEFVGGILNAMREDGRDYIRVIKGLDLASRLKGTRWLAGIVDGIMGEILGHLTSFK